MLHSKRCRRLCDRLQFARVATLPQCGQIPRLIYWHGALGSRLSNEGCTDTFTKASSPDSRERIFLDTCAFVGKYSFLWGTPSYILVNRTELMVTYIFVMLKLNQMVITSLTLADLR